MGTPEFSVVGGGIAGLAVARRLALAGRPVVLFEASDRLGGTVEALEPDGGRAARQPFLTAVHLISPSATAGGPWSRDHIVP